MSAPEISPSREIEAVVQRLMRALSQGDCDTVMNLFSDDPALTYIGTADEEVWTRDMLRRGYADYIRAIPEFAFSDVQVTAYETGTLGWAFWTANWRFAGSDRDIRFRTTTVLRLEKGHWRVIQLHNSTPVSNVENIGYDYTRLDELVAAARQSHAGEWSGIATIMFTDIAGSAAIAAAVGDARWLDLVGRHLDGVAAIVGETGGRMVKTLGDGTMSTFGSARAALAAATAIQRALGDTREEPRLRARIGIHTGEVLQTTDDFFGTVVNKAARVAGAAQPGEIRVSEETRMMVGDTPDAHFTDPQRAALKGLADDQVLHRLEWRE